ncbi:permease prefix domain 1-containing protein [Naasia aerilata]|uniref:Uncharacterized protein n=1 Tax=Naasia aerilata TaxID=1162966 RepID=A0ABN6XKS0_9MICO|nr:permease prefix domain 1-containing protein [Naasia aerilata]BDZ44357.1 hypothetical protein GCM10025866_02660 [Naasia aerilata]
MTQHGPARSSIGIHRMLDDAFAGMEMTPDLQDLKEEIRANLVTRAEELERSGVPARDAAAQAMAELGDIRSALGDGEAGGDAAASTRPSPTVLEEWARNRVRPKPAFVLRTVLLSALALIALLVVVLDLFAVVDTSSALRGVALAVLALAAGALVTDGLRQETTGNYPLPLRRAAAFGLAAVVLLIGVGCGLMSVPGFSAGWILAGVLATVLSIALLTYLGVTQTNRHKPWRVHAASNTQIPDRFTEDPASAARFGMYTVAIWVSAFALFVVLSFTIGWAWSWLALLAGFVAMMLVLANMLFPARRRSE